MEIHYRGNIEDQPELVLKQVKTVLNTNGVPPVEELQAYWDEILVVPVSMFDGTERHHPIDHPYKVEWSDKFTSSGARIWLGRGLVRVSVRHHVQHGMGETKDALRHEAAHAIEYWVHGSSNHTNRFRYYLQIMGGSRYTTPLSRNIICLVTAVLSMTSALVMVLPRPINLAMT